MGVAFGQQVISVDGHYHRMARVNGCTVAAVDARPAEKDLTEVRLKIADGE